VYCRPICPARTPKREHMVFFPTAAAAQAAGFRPCLRCRPEAAPSLATWPGTSATIARALALIDAGELDDNNADVLAQRLGIGARQLRRLFREHVGASVVSVAQTRRVLLAKQLLHETDLPITEVALAAGFASIRRFNEVFKTLFGRPPSALRRDGVARAVGGASRHDLVVRMWYRPPYDWPAMVAFLATRAIAGVEVVTPDRYARTIDIAGTTGTVIVEPAEGKALRAGVRFPSVSALPTILGRLRRMFDLGAEPESIGTHLARDPLLAPLVSSRPGLRVPGAWDGFELAARAILGQQVSVRAGVDLVSRLVADHGTVLRPDDRDPPGLTSTFPRPEAIATADLSTLGMPRARSRALAALAAAVVADPHILGVGPSLEERVDRLRLLPGIGQWTAQYIALRLLREPDAFPAQDAGLKRAIAQAEGRRPTTAGLLERAEAWRPWRAYAAQHLWTAAWPRPVEWWK
jgi:AraC family transcriptional regulator, regulatory protein of adaptative response / DNA-3-methyladenine glycosylase II